MRVLTHTLERFDDRPVDPLDLADGTEDPDAAAELPPIDPDNHPDVLALKAQLSAVLDTQNVVIAEFGRRRDDVARDLGDLVGTMATQLLPALADRAFAAEVATAVANALLDGAPRTAVLKLAPETAAFAAEHLSRLGLTGAVEIVTDSDKSETEAQMIWEDGGADFDVATITRETLDALSERLAIDLDRKATG